mmetsp:Transcript_14549/g.58078  ORF Transcript_14549/g.58078 Transcript_14549/m.58078 type:complete len:1257 (-) Transcript_14549:1342-5112(-)
MGRRLGLLLLCALGSPPLRAAFRVPPYGSPSLGVSRRASQGGDGSEPQPTRGPGIAPPQNVLGGELECCCADVRGSGVGTGFFRDGHCSTGPQDAGRHTVCCVATADFLEFSKAVGNDLSTPRPEFWFPGLLPGDRWCLCAARWAEALEAGVAPAVYLRATHEATLRYATLDALRSVVTLGCRAIHFAGHGHPEFLCFEDGKGGAVAASNDALRRLVSAGGAGGVRLVVVNSCHSQRAGDAFAAAGVPHVVAVSTRANSDGRVSDRAATAFCRAFYLGVIAGRTVRQAFDIGCAAAASINTAPVVAAAASSSSSAGRRNSAPTSGGMPPRAPTQQLAAAPANVTYVLLPENAPHDERIFADAPPGALDVVMPARTPCNAPATPTYYLGRDRDLFCLVDAMLRHRLTTVAGSFGCGKSALAATAATYLAERGCHFDAVVWVRVGSRDRLVEDVIEATRRVIFKENAADSATVSHRHRRAASLDGGGLASSFGEHRNHRSSSGLSSAGAASVPPQAPPGWYTNASGGSSAWARLLMSSSEHAAVSGGTAGALRESMVLQGGPQSSHLASLSGASAASAAPSLSALTSASFRAPSVLSGAASDRSSECGGVRSATATQKVTSFSALHGAPRAMIGGLEAVGDDDEDVKQKHHAAAFLRDKRVLVVLDDFEKLLVATPKLALQARAECQRALASLLAAASKARVVLTCSKGSGLGRSTSVTERVIKLKPLEPRAAATLLLHRSPELARRATNAKAARGPRVPPDALVSAAAAHPVVRRLAGNPFAIALSATLLNSLFESEEAADTAARAAARAEKLRAVNNNDRFLGFLLKPSSSSGAVADTSSAALTSPSSSSDASPDADAAFAETALFERPELPRNRSKSSPVPAYLDDDPLEPLDRLHRLLSRHEDEVDAAAGGDDDDPENGPPEDPDLRLRDEINFVVTRQEHPNTTFGGAAAASSGAAAAASAATHAAGHHAAAAAPPGFLVHAPSETPYFADLGAPPSLTGGPPRPSVNGSRSPSDGGTDDDAASGLSPRRVLLAGDHPHAGGALVASRGPTPRGGDDARSVVNDVMTMIPQHAATPPPPPPLDRRTFDALAAALLLAWLARLGLDAYRDPARALTLRLDAVCHLFLDIALLVVLATYLPVDAAPAASGGPRRSASSSASSSRGGLGVVASPSEGVVTPEVLNNHPEPSVGGSGGSMMASGAGTSSSSQPGRGGSAGGASPASLLSTTTPKASSPPPRGAPRSGSAGRLHQYLG